jgi:hypothetical protein
MSKTTTKKTVRGIALGSLVKDNITGFIGIAIGRTEFGFGCIHIRVQAQGLTKEGEPIPTQSFDEQRMEVLKQSTKSWPQPKETPIKLGDMVRDPLTGAVGIASAKTSSLEGDVNILIEQAGLREDGSPKPPLYASADRVVVEERRELKVSKDSVATSGGPYARAPLPR